MNTTPKDDLEQPEPQPDAAERSIGRDEPGEREHNAEADPAPYESEGEESAGAPRRPRPWVVLDHEP